jgi:hypothetical protein
VRRSPPEASRSFSKDIMRRSDDMINPLTARLLDSSLRLLGRLGLQIDLRKGGFARSPPDRFVRTRPLERRRKPSLARNALR